MYVGELLGRVRVALFEPRYSVLLGFGRVVASMNGVTLLGMASSSVTEILLASVCGCTTALLACTRFSSSELLPLLLTTAGFK